MRTNIVLNDELVREAQSYSNTRTKKALIEEALRTYIEVMHARRKRESYGQRLADVRTRLAGLRLRESSASILRSDRRR